MVDGKPLRISPMDYKRTETALGCWSRVPPGRHRNGQNKIMAYVASDPNTREYVGMVIDGEKRGPVAKAVFDWLIQGYEVDRFGVEKARKLVKKVA